MPVQIRSNLFGVHIEELMGYDGEKSGIPRVVKDCAQYLRQTGAFFCIWHTSSSDHFCQA
jgi:Rho GTPase-activating protein 1